MPARRYMEVNQFVKFYDTGKVIRCAAAYFAVCEKCGVIVADYD